MGEREVARGRMRVMGRRFVMRGWIGTLMWCAWAVPVLAAGGAVSDEDLKAIAVKAQDTIRSGKVDEYDALWDNPVTLDRITQNIAAPLAIKAGFLKGMGTGLGKTLGGGIA